MLVRSLSYWEHFSVRSLSYWEHFSVAIAPAEVNIEEEWLFSLIRFEADIGSSLLSLGEAVLRLSEQNRKSQDSLS
ncbi:hypothetical protein T484DRAFT_1806247 [Baffinella frigidus]|nr:hypothetical protein T484DRAFT_1806247 [Cryptophyta sp. CCMP2293]